MTRPGHARLPEDKVRVVTDVSPDIADALREMAHAKDRSTAAEIRLALRTWVEDAAARDLEAAA